ncbi:MAG: SH3 domain-containing protein [Anaerolineales bacterium]|nr:SH3 domain-containing protein [Anaerolineales bacterium]
MFNKHPALVSFVVLLIASLACVLPGAPTLAPLDPNAANTSIAQTVSARQTMSVLNNPATPTFTNAPETPTLTAEPTFSPEPDFTPTSGTPMISVSVDTNCRVGPGAIFERVGILLVGETAEIVGREPRGEYWYIRNPDEGAEFCWVWGEYATITGNTLPLLYLSPPPPPSASLGLSFEKLETCNNYWTDFRLENKSGVVFRSMSITLTDTDTDPVTIVAQSANGFTNSDACSGPVTTPTLVSGGFVTVSSPQLPYNPSGHAMVVKITVCTNENQAGTCITQELNFKP